MYLLYSVLMVGWGILLIPALLYRAWRHQKYLPGLRQRFGRLPESLRWNGRPTVWIHACSVGETLSAQPLVHGLHQRFPEIRIAVSTITGTGQAIARERFARYGEGNTFFFPVDLACVARRVLNWIRPSMLLILDTEIWPNVLHQARRRGIPVILINGRISAKSFRHYRLARHLLRFVFQDYGMLLMRSEEDAERIRFMGAPADRVYVTGNIKYDRDLVEKEFSEAQARSLADALGLAEADSSLIVAGSTHQGEEQILLEVLQNIRRTTGLDQTRLLLVPRHPERFDAVADLAARSGFSVRRRTEPGNQTQAAVLLLDTIGELATAYRFATIAFVGGTLIPHGGQSILEPALYAKPIVIGPSMENFTQIIEEFRARAAVRQITAGDTEKPAQIRQLTETFTELLQNASARDELGRAAYSIFERNRGAITCTLQKIAEIYERHRQVEGNAGKPARYTRGGQEMGK
jgi:3-deoxy-D-manno-octulosonic-acid transferase